VKNVEVHNILFMHLLSFLLFVRRFVCTSCPVSYRTRDDVKGRADSQSAASVNHTPTCESSQTSPEDTRESGTHIAKKERRTTTTTK
jgi:hypothetical protein